MTTIINDIAVSFEQAVGVAGPWKAISAPEEDMNGEKCLEIKPGHYFRIGFALPPSHKGDPPLRSVALHINGVEVWPGVTQSIFGGILPCRASHWSPDAWTGNPPKEPLDFKFGDMIEFTETGSESNFTQGHDPLFKTTARIRVTILTLVKRVKLLPSPRSL